MSTGCHLLPYTLSLSCDRVCRSHQLSKCRTIGRKGDSTPPSALPGRTRSRSAPARCFTSGTNTVVNQENVLRLVAATAREMGVLAPMRLVA